ncbi:Glycosyltransferase involved in cell wall bisynthesis [Tenacibaculum sp. 190524A02b]|uniref:Glycosyltransferase involved in cell wall bisynthesis n=1 Tax=Tenacibaculum vairaonense TaxID=3137860 RepID=A0ABM9PGY0_9FLAO
MKKIIVSVTNDITTDQRVAKVCNTLHNLGYEILLIGRKLPTSKLLNRKYKTKRFNLLFNNGFLFYAEYNIRLLLFLLFTKKDLLFSNDLDTLLPNFIISKLQRKQLIYDSHELFPEIPELIQRPFVKKVWEKLESIILPKLKNCLTVSQSIADFYNDKYETDFKVLRNVPVKKEVQKGVFPFDTQNKKIIIYQGAVNLGRGIELMVNSMHYLKGFIFVIAGVGDVINEIKTLVNEKNLNNSVFFLGRLSPKDLKKITPLADLGMSLEEDLGLSYRYSLPNKLFDYIQAEIPVITSDLPEMRNIVSSYTIGQVVIDRTPESIAKQIESITNENYSNNLKKAKNELIWENEEIVLKNILNNLK